MRDPDTLRVGEDREEEPDADREETAGADLHGASTVAGMGFPYSQC
jgi:hypothetical protein